MAPEIIRPEPMYLQIAGQYKQMMVSGEMEAGTRLPSVRALERSWGVSHSVAQQAIGYLRTEGLVRTGPGGTYALGLRVKRGPQQWAEATSYPANERLEIRAAGVIPAPDYIVPIFGLTPATDGITYVIRREWLTYEWNKGSVPLRLSVSWCPPWARRIVPELLDRWPLPNPAGAAPMIAERDNLVITGHKVFDEARPAKNDGREGPLLYPGETPGCIMAKVELWWTRETVLEYSEHAIVQCKVIETDLLP